MAYQETDYVSTDDYVMILQDGCVKIIRFEDFIKGISLGGFSVCQAWLNCVGGIGIFPGEEPPINTPPTMEDLYIPLQNREQNRVFTSNEFLDKYYDAEGDPLGKIIITGGDVTGYTLNGSLVSVGMIIDVSELSNLEYDSKNQDASYVQDLYFEAYDINNVKAESI